MRKPGHQTPKVARGRQSQILYAVIHLFVSSKNYRSVDADALFWLEFNITWTENSDVNNPETDHMEKGYNRQLIVLVLSFIFQSKWN